MAISYKKPLKNLIDKDIGEKRLMCSWYKSYINGRARKNENVLLMFCQNLQVINYDIGDTIKVISDERKLKRYG